MNATLPRVGVVGVGLIGGSLGLALRARGARVVGVDPSQQVLDRAVERGAIDEGSVSPEVLSEAELVFLAAPLDRIAEVGEQLLPHLRAGCLLTDVASVKSPIVQRLEGASGIRFLGGHPIFGTEGSGIEAARAELLEGAPYLITPTSKTAARAVEELSAVATLLGMRPVVLPPEEHDRLLASLSHLPQLVAAALCRLAPSMDVAGPSFRDATRVAMSPVGLLAEIAQQNRAALTEVAAQLGQELLRLAALPQDALATELSVARQRRLQFEEKLAKRRSVLAARVRNLAASPTVAVSEKARALVAAGVKVIDLGGGDPEFDTPEHIRKAAAQALEAGQTHYVASAGLAPLRKAIAKKFETENGLRVEAEGGILITPGGKAAIFEALLALVEPGVDVLVIEPAWVSFGPMVELAGGRVVPVALQGPDFRLTHELLAAAITPRTKVLVVNSPNNPTGRVLDESEREAVRRLVLERELILLSDEVYEKLVYGDARHVSFASLPGLSERTLTVNAFSKAYAMTGWRLGYLAGPVSLIREVAKIHSHSITCVAGFAQQGALAALEGPQDFIALMVATYDRRRRLVTQRLSSIPGVRCELPQGALYAFAEVTGTGRSGAQAAEELLHKAHVAVTPGGAFGRAGQGYVRLALTSADGVLEEALQRITQCLSK